MPQGFLEAQTLVNWGFGSPNYDLSADGERFLMSKPEPQTNLTRQSVVLAWFEELDRLVPTEN